MPATRDPGLRIPIAAIAAAVLALPSAFVLIILGWTALVLADSRADGGVWIVLLIAVGWLVGLLVGAIRLLLGRSWLGLAFPAGALTALMMFGLLRGGLGAGPYGLGTLSLLTAFATAVLASLPAVRNWVSQRRHARLFPGSAQRTSSRP